MNTEQRVISIEIVTISMKNLWQIMIDMILYNEISHRMAQLLDRYLTNRLSFTDE